MVSDTAYHCAGCGRRSSVSPAGEQGCPYCRLRLGLSGISAGESVRRSLGISLSGEELSENESFLRAGVLPEFGDYELLCEIARGGMGAVYRARQRTLNRLVAVKLILAGQLATPESVQRFRLEAEAAARLHHPGIVPIYEIGEYETQHFYSMELIDGVSLAECMPEFVLGPDAPAADRRQQETCIAELVSRVARALEFAHQHGVLHRDLKPSNILIDQEGLPHLTDFGLAKLTGQEEGGLTLTQAVLGTPGYLAPEQAAGSADITTSADVYGLGATLYELLTGRPPFVGENAVKTMWMALHETPVAPRRIQPQVPRDLETIALKCLEKTPAQRYPSAAAVAEELDRYLRKEPIQARPVSAGEHVWRWCQRNPRLAFLSATLLLTIVIGSAAAFWQWNRAERANVRLLEKVADLQWGEIDAMLQAGQASRALAKSAYLVRQSPHDWKAAMFALSVLDQHRFPVPVSAVFRHPDGAELTVARLSPDGRAVVTASFDGTARLWNPLTGKALVPELRHAGTVTWAEFSPDGNWLATSSDDKTARVWDVATGQPLCEPLTHEEPVSQALFSPDGQYLLTRTPRALTLWEVPSGRIHRGPLSHDGKIIGAKFLRDGRTFWSAQQAGPDSRVQAWDVVTGERRFQLTVGPMTQADVSPDLAHVVTSEAGRAHVWEVATGKRRQEIESRHGHIHTVLFSPDGQRLATGTTGQCAQVWDVASGVPTTPEFPHYYHLNGISFVGDGTRLLTWGDDSLAQLWDLSTGEACSEPMRHSQRVIHAEAGRIDAREVFLTTISHLKSRSESTRTGAAQLWRVHEKRGPEERSKGHEPRAHDAIQISRDGRLLVVGNTTEEVWVLEVATGKTVCGPLRLHGGSWSSFFNSDGTELITITSRGQVSRWSIPGGERLGEPVQIPTMFQPAEMSLDGRYFATGSTDGFVRLWNSSTGQVVHEMRHGSEINSVAFTPAGDFLASAGEDRVVRIWEVASGRPLRELKGHQNEVTRIVYSPDGRSLLSSSHDTTVRVWDAVTGHQRHLLQHQGEVLESVYSPDGKYIASGSRDRTAMIWDAATGQPLVPSLRHTQAVRNVRFSPDGERLLTLDFRGLRLWDVATGHPLTVPLPQFLWTGIGFQCTCVGPIFTPDGNRVFVAESSPHAYLWDVAPPPPGVPEWFPDFLEAIAGQRFTSEGAVPEIVPPAKFLALRDRLLQDQSADDYTRRAQTWLRDR